MRSYQNKAVGTFEDLGIKSKEFIKEIIKDTLESNCEIWSDREVEDIEHEHRDGFIPNSDNKGGVLINGFTDLMSMWGSGTRVAHVKAQAEIERQIEYSLECARENFFNNNKEVLEKHNVTQDMIDYNTLQELGAKFLELEGFCDNFAEYENDNLMGGDSSIMFQVRVMYHGVVDGVHSASVSCAVNTEGPYHRSSIPWASGVFCEGANEIEIEWSTLTQLKTRLTKALKDTSKAIF